ncbi:MAG: hypothetical protein K2R98_33675 [Gemmataceae bacterium]|nr:hypothetical protein [Gemmataceae bacterium]
MSAAVRPEDARDVARAATPAARGHGLAPKGIATFLFWAVVFALVYTQAPLYYSNQNQYFLHGLAQGGRGLLDADWLAGTRDPTPVFTALVAITYRLLPEQTFQLYYVLVFGIYFWSMVAIFDTASGKNVSPLMRHSFIVLLLLIHSAVLRWLSWRWLDTDYPWYLQCGVANQYVLGPVFQPSVFGTGLILSIALFVRGRPYLAVSAAALTAVAHSTYLLGAAILTLSYMVNLCREQRWKDALRLGGLALLFVAPVLVYIAVNFAPSSAEKFAASQALLVHFRIPHHAVVRHWLDGIAAAQVVGVMVAIGLVRRSPLGAVMLLSAVMGFALSAVQVLTNNDSLALLFPWRVTAYLVPIATTVLLARLVSVLAVATVPPWQRTALGLANAAGIAVLVAAGIAITVQDLGYPAAREDVPVMDYVRERKQPGQLYTLPISLPKPQASAQSPLSQDFRPTIQAGDRQRLPFDLQRFRLYTGAPIFIDFKSIPYQDVEVLEWNDRVAWNRRLYARLDKKSLGDMMDEMIRQRITHVITRMDQKVRCEELVKVYDDGQHRIYEFKE